MRKISLLAILLLMFVSTTMIFAQVYTTEEYVVEGDTVVGDNVTTYTTTTTTGGTVVTPLPPTTELIVVPAEQDIYIGMGRAHLRDLMGPPADLQRFKARRRGIYDEIWTYLTPTGTIYVYMRERRVLRIEYD